MRDNLSPLCMILYTGVSSIPELYYIDVYYIYVWWKGDYKQFAKLTLFTKLFCLSWNSYIVLTQKYLLFIPHATSCGGYNVFDLSVSQSVSPLSLGFFASATPLKPLNRIWWNLVVMKDIMFRCAYPQEILIPLFLIVTPFLH